MPCPSLEVQYSHARYIINSVLTISTSYLGAAGYSDNFFSSCNITDRVYRGEWMGRSGGRRGWVESRRQAKTTIGTQAELMCLQFGTLNWSNPQGASNARDD